MKNQKFLIQSIFASILIAIAFGCKNDIALNESNRVYHEELSHFDSEYVNHFPISIENHPMRIWLDTNALTDHVRVMLQIDFKKKHYDSLLQSFKSQSIANYNAADTCLLVVNRFTQKENWHLKNKRKYVDRSKIERDCYLTKFPIPNFWDNQYLTFDTETRLPVDFDIYVFKAESGEFWDENHRTRGQYMPKGWKNGYSKGIAISKKRYKLIYWFILW